MKGSDTEESGEADSVRCRRSMPRRGARGGVQDLATAEPSTLARKRNKWIGERSCGGARWCADRVYPKAPPCEPLLYLHRWNPSSRGPPSAMA
jgi:hypothetical protein